jgi:oligopeptide transport system substrate-binding protein
MVYGHVRRRLGVTAIATAALLVGAAGGYGPQSRALGVGAARTAVFRMDLQQEPPSMDPQGTTLPEAELLMTAMFDGLLTYEVDRMVVAPNLASSYGYSPDGKTLTVHIKPGIRFPNGDLLTSADVKYSIVRNLQPATKSAYESAYDDIVEAKDYFAGKATDVSGIETPDPQTIVFHLNAPEGYFLNILALMSSFVSDHAAPDADEATKIARNPMGTGAFKLESWQPNVSMILARNPFYNRTPRPQITRVEITFGPTQQTQIEAFQRGEVEAVWGLGPLDPSLYLQIVNHATLTRDYVYSDSPWVFYIPLSLDLVPAFKDVRVRQAMNYAVDKQYVIRKGLNGRGTVFAGAIPPGIPGYDPSLTPYPYDPNKAKQLLAEAGWSKGFDVEFAERPGNEQVPVIVQQQLARVGVRMALKKVTFAQWFAMRRQHQLQMTNATWLMDYPDAQDYLYYTLDSHSPFNAYGYRNPQFDGLVEEADASTNQSDRITLYRQANRIAIHDAPWIFMYNQRTDALYQQWVQPRNVNVLLNPVLGFLWDVARVVSH